MLFFFPFVVFKKNTHLAGNWKYQIDIYSLKPCVSHCSYVLNPVLVIIDVQPKELGIPTKAYYAVEEVKEVTV